MRCAAALCTTIHRINARRAWLTAALLRGALPAASTRLSPESVDQTKREAGAHINLGWVNFALGADRTGDITRCGAKSANNGFHF